MPWWFQDLYKSPVSMQLNRFAKMFDFAQGLCWWCNFNNRCFILSPIHLNAAPLKFTRFRFLVVFNAFYCKDCLFESIPRASLEHSKLQTVDNHITHTAAPCAALSPIHSLWNVLMLVFVPFFFGLYLPWFPEFTLILIWAELIRVDHPTFIFVFIVRSGWHSLCFTSQPSFVYLTLSIQQYILCTCRLCSVAKQWQVA